MKNHFDIWSATESSKADSQDGNIKILRKNIGKKEQRLKEKQWHFTEMP